MLVLNTLPCSNHCLAELTLFHPHLTLFIFCLPKEKKNSYIIYIITPNSLRTKIFHENCWTFCPAVHYISLDIHTTYFFQNLPKIFVLFEGCGSDLDLWEADRDQVGRGYLQLQGSTQGQGHEAEQQGCQE